MIKSLNCILIAGVAAWLVGCSGGNVAGTYTSAEHEKTTLTINQDGTFVYNPYGSGTYKVDGSNIAMTNPMWGATTGKIEGGTLVFPEGLNKFGKTFMGTWVRQ